LESRPVYYAPMTQPTPTINPWPITCGDSTGNQPPFLPSSTCWATNMENYNKMVREVWDGEKG